MVPFVKQEKPNECGVAALTAIATYFMCKQISYQKVLNYCSISSQGLSINSLCYAARSIGLEPLPIWCNIDNLIEIIPKPCIALWNKDHYIVVTKVDGERIWIVDPAFGKFIYDRNTFVRWWCEADKGIIIVFNKVDSK